MATTRRDYSSSATALLELIHCPQRPIDNPKAGTQTTLLEFIPPVHKRLLEDPGQELRRTLLKFIPSAAND